MWKQFTIWGNTVISIWIFYPKYQNSIITPNMAPVEASQERMKELYTLI